MIGDHRATMKLEQIMRFLRKNRADYSGIEVRKLGWYKMLFLYLSFLFFTNSLSNTKTFRYLCNILNALN